MSLRALGAGLCLVVAAGHLLEEVRILSPTLLEEGVLARKAGLPLVGVLEPGGVVAVGHQLIPVAGSLYAFARNLALNSEHLLWDDSAFDVNSSKSVKEVGEGFTLKLLPQLHKFRDVDVRTKVASPKFHLELVEPHRRYSRQIVRLALEMVLCQGAFVGGNPPHVSNDARFCPQDVSTAEPCPKRLVGVFATPATHGTVVPSGECPPVLRSCHETSANHRDSIGFVVVPPEVGIEVDVTFSCESTVLLFVPFVDVQISNHRHHESPGLLL
mmetsp:Transcript_79254/g.164508  ORF Transcript_79254/g.164508 Transcript_79254/m.164508 type:complete len:271 (-) Transcript_79254:856-1668(-)